MFQHLNSFNTCPDVGFSLSLPERCAHGEDFGHQAVELIETAPGTAGGQTFEDVAWAGWPPSSKPTENYGKSPFLIGKLGKLTSFLWPCSIANC